MKIRTSGKESRQIRERINALWDFSGFREQLENTVYQFLVVWFSEGKQAVSIGGVICGNSEKWIARNPRILHQN